MSKHFLKLGLSQKDIIYLFVFKHLKQGPAHTAKIFRHIIDFYGHRDLLGKKRSQSYVYASINEMFGYGWIDYVEEGRKKVYRLTPKGEERLKLYKSSYLDSFKRLKSVLCKMIDDMRQNRFANEGLPLLYQKDKQYLSRLINVREFISFFVLNRLIFEGASTGMTIYKTIKEIYGWELSRGYFYQVMHDLDQNGWIKGKWLDDYTRSEREYMVLPYGRENYLMVLDKVSENVNLAFRLIRSLLALFEEKREELIRA